MFNSLNKGKLINIRNPNFNRPWQHVLEPLNGYLILAEKLYRIQKFSGHEFWDKKKYCNNVLEIVKQIVKIWGKEKLNLKLIKIL